LQQLRTKNILKSSLIVRQPSQAARTQPLHAIKNVPAQLTQARPRSSTDQQQQLQLMWKCCFSQADTFAATTIVLPMVDGQ
jgi:site-specific recombinase